MHQQATYAAVNRQFLHQEIKPFSDDKGVRLYTSCGHTENCNPHNWTPNHFVVCFPISSTESNEINEPDHKKSKLCADSDNTRAGNPHGLTE